MRLLQKNALATLVPARTLALPKDIGTMWRTLPGSAGVTGRKSVIIKT
jgi:hypothetical protein